MGILLTLIAYILIAIFTPIGLFVGIIVSLSKRECNSYFKDIAIALDQFGNVVCKYVLNALMIKKGGYKFGNVDETVSSCIGKNQLFDNLTLFGKFINFVLNKLEKNHSIKSIEKL